MPVPKRRTSKTKRNMRRSHHALSKPNMTECPSCSQQVIAHRVCPHCGHYKDRLVVDSDKA